MESTYSVSSTNRQKSAATDLEVALVRNGERVREIRDVLGLISNNLAIPLYLAFWICDIIYVPHLKWELLVLRLAVVPLCFLVRFYIGKVQTYFSAQVLCLVFISALASFINAMIVMIGSAETPYVSGLNLVAIGTLAFIPWTKLFYFLTVVAIYLPYFSYCTYYFYVSGNYVFSIISLFFIFGTVLISFIMRYFNESLRYKEVQSRLALEDEIENRDALIERKAIEAVNLRSLSNQFSPQVVQAIKDGKIDLTKGVHRSEICAIFIDIVNSTDRVARLDKDKVNRVLSLFMENTMTVLLKYDITIDKFLGDGVLAFANDPVAYPDFVERVANAAFDILRKIEENKNEYINNWHNELHVKIGISVGYANVGFYGSEKYFKSYTAIGPVVNMASRLCQIANDNQVVVNYDVCDKLKNSDFQFKPLGAQKLKGFEGDLINVFLVEQSVKVNASVDISECPKCSTIMHLSNDERGLFILKCRQCGYVLDKVEKQSKKRVA